MIRRLEKLKSAADALARGDYHARVPEKGRDELSDVAATFNNMAESRQQAEGALRESEARFRSAFADSAIGMALVSPDARLLQVNNSLCQITGYSEKELLEKTFQDLTHPDDLHIGADYLARLLEGEIDAARFEKRYIHKDGHTIWVLITTSMLRDAEGNPLHLVAQTQDITSGKQAERELTLYRDHLEEIVAERTASLDRAEKELKNFAYIVSHDLRSPLTSIQGFAGELRHSLEAIREAVEVGLPAFDQARQDAMKREIEEHIPEALDFILAGVSKMDGLVKAVLELSRLGRRELQHEAVDIKQVVERNLKALAFTIEEQGIEVKLGPLPILNTDRLAMEQIFGNLLSNAVKYQDINRPGIIEVSAEEGEDVTTFHVRDNGRGIAEKDISRVFEIFQRAADHGEVGDGMGLTYTQTLVWLLGGRISCESELGRGTTFSFTVPHGAQGNQ